MEQIRKRRQLSGSSAGHKTKRIFYSLHLRESSPSTHTPQGWSPQSLVARSKCEQALSVGDRSPGREASLPAEAREAENSQPAPPSFLSGPSGKFPPSFLSCPPSLLLPRYIRSLKP